MDTCPLFRWLSLLKSVTFLSISWQLPLSLFLSLFLYLSIFHSLSLFICFFLFLSLSFTSFSFSFTSPFLSFFLCLLLFPFSLTPYFYILLLQLRWFYPFLKFFYESFTLAPQSLAFSIYLLKIFSSLFLLFFSLSSIFVLSYFYKKSFLSPIYTPQSKIYQIDQNSINFQHC